MLLTLLLNRQIQAFAELGRLWQSVNASFADPVTVTNSDVLRDVQDLLEEETGRLKRIFDLTIDPDTDTFRGKAEQRITLARSQFYGFRITPDQMVYKLIDSPDVENFGEDDADWAEVLEYAAKTGTKLNCKPGNVQCGGKCQSGKLNCFHGMTAAQKKAAQAAVKKAKAAAPKAAAAKSNADSKATKPKSKPALKSAIPADFPKDPSKLIAIKPLGGSTSAMLVKDPDTGKQYVMKKGSSADHLRSEFAADRAYEAMGVKVPKGGLYETEDGPVKLAEFIEGKELQSLKGAAREKAINQLKENFAADALLGNWDVIGLGQDNILVAKNGDVYRIDNGGALAFRAQGKPKTGTQWNEHPTELWSMREPPNSASAIYGDMTISQTLAGSSKISKNQQQLLDSLPPETQAIVKKRLDTMTKLAEIAKASDNQAIATDAQLNQYTKGIVNQMQSGTLGKVPTLKKALKELSQEPDPEEDFDLEGLFAPLGTPAVNVAKQAQDKIYAAGDPGASIAPNKALSVADRKQIEDHFETGQTSTTFSGFNNAITNWQYKMSQPDWTPPPPPPSASELAAVNIYTTGSYNKFNKLLRKKNDWYSEMNYEDQADENKLELAANDTIKVTKLASSGIAQLPKYQGVVYRGTSLNSEQLTQYVVGQSVTEKAFSSSSRVKAGSFSGNTQYVITSKNGATVENYSAFSNEKEVLFAPNTQFMVTKKSTHNGKTIIHMEEL